MNIIKQTKIEQTEEKYKKRTVQLIRKCMKELEIEKESDLDMRQFVAWLNDKKPELSRPSWRQYKSSVVYFLEQIKGEEAITALEYIRDIDSSGCILKSTKTSSQKLKKISLEEWDKIEDYLTKHKSKWSEHLRCWMKSGLLTGLRPIEWKNTKFFIYENNNEKIPALLVENAKQTNGRANGATRTLLLDELAVDELKVLRDHLANVRAFKAVGTDGFENFYSSCALTLHKICRKIWRRRKKHITLYSTRHQFSANAKSTGFSKLEVAAMMGHAVDITATIHYGKKLAGNDKVLIKPIQGEVDTVRAIDSSKIQNIIQTKRDNTL